MALKGRTEGAKEARNEGMNEVTKEGRQMRKLEEGRKKDDQITCSWLFL